MVKSVPCSVTCQHALACMAPSWQHFSLHLSRCIVSKWMHINSFFMVYAQPALNTWSRTKIAYLERSRLLPWNNQKYTIHHRSMVTMVHLGLIGVVSARWIPVTYDHIEWPWNLECWCTCSYRLTQRSQMFVCVFLCITVFFYFVYYCNCVT